MRPIRGRRPLGPTLSLGLALVVAACGEHARAAAPPPTAAPQWLLDGGPFEALMTGRSTVDRAFRFTDARAASGITFVDRVVDDAARTYKPAHYDHGTGVAAADVDGDGRPDLYFASQLGTGELWRNLGGGKFENATDRAGLPLTDVIAVAPAFADVDNDGDPDLFLTTVRHGNRLFENVGGGRFRDITAQAGVGYVGHSSGAVFFDYDGDGRLDLFVANVGRYTTEAKGRGGFYVAVKDAFHGHTHADRAESSILYRNLGGNRFQDVTRETGLADASWSGDATPIDANDDGRPDLYVCDMQGENHLWLNVDGAHFPRRDGGVLPAHAVRGDARERARRGRRRPPRPLRDGHALGHVRGDRAGGVAGRAAEVGPGLIPPDYLPNGTARLLFGNALFVRGAPGDSAPYVESSRRLGGETYWPWGASVGDLNADGWPDLFVTAGMGFPFRYGVNAVLMNDAGRHLVRSEFTLGVEPRARTALDWFTVDCGRADRGHASCGVCAQARGDSTVCRATRRGRSRSRACRAAGGR